MASIKVPPPVSQKPAWKPGEYKADPTSPPRSEKRETRRRKNVASPELSSPEPTSPRPLSAESGDFSMRTSAIYVHEELVNMYVMAPDEDHIERVETSRRDTSISLQLGEPEVRVRSPSFSQASQRLSELARSSSSLNSSFNSPPMSPRLAKSQAANVENNEKVQHHKSEPLPAPRSPANGGEFQSEDTSTHKTSSSSTTQKITSTSTGKPPLPKQSKPPQNQRSSTNDPATQKRLSAFVNKSPQQQFQGTQAKDVQSLEKKEQSRDSGEEDDESSSDWSDESLEFYNERFIPGSLQNLSYRDIVPLTKTRTVAKSQSDISFNPPSFVSSIPKPKVMTRSQTDLRNEKPSPVVQEIDISESRSLPKPIQFKPGVSLLGLPRPYTSVKDSYGRVQFSLLKSQANEEVKSKGNNSGNGSNHRDNIYGSYPGLSKYSFTTPSLKSPATDVKTDTDKDHIADTGVKHSVIAKETATKTIHQPTKSKDRESDKENVNEPIKSKIGDSTSNTTISSPQLPVNDVKEVEGVKKRKVKTKNRSSSGATEDSVQRSSQISNGEEKVKKKKVKKKDKSSSGTNAENVPAEIPDEEERLVKGKETADVISSEVTLSASSQRDSTEEKIKQEVVKTKVRSGSHAEEIVPALSQIYEAKGAQKKEAVKGNDRLSSSAVKENSPAITYIDDGAPDENGAEYKRSSATVPSVTVPLQSDGRDENARRDSVGTKGSSATEEHVPEALPTDSITEKEEVKEKRPKSQEKDDSVAKENPPVALQTNDLGEKVIEKRVKNKDRSESNTKNENEPVAAQTANGEGSLKKKKVKSKDRSSIATEDGIHSSQSLERTGKMKKKRVKSKDRSSATGLEEKVTKTFKQAPKETDTRNKDTLNVSVTEAKMSDIFTSKSAESAPEMVKGIEPASSEQDYPPVSVQEDVPSEQAGEKGSLKKKKKRRKSADKGSPLSGQIMISPPVVPLQYDANQNLDVGKVHAQVEKGPLVQIVYSNPDLGLTKTKVEKAPKSLEQAPDELKILETDTRSKDTPIRNANDERMPKMYNFKSSGYKTVPTFDDSFPEADWGIHDRSVKKEVTSSAKAPESDQNWTVPVPSISCETDISSNDLGPSQLLCDVETRVKGHASEELHKIPTDEIPSAITHRLKTPHLKNDTNLEVGVQREMKVPGDISHRCARTEVTIDTKPELKGSGVVQQVKIAGNDVKSDVRDILEQGKRVPTDLQEELEHSSLKKDTENIFSDVKAGVDNFDISGQVNKLPTDVTVGLKNGESKEPDVVKKKKKSSGSDKKKKKPAIEQADVKSSVEQGSAQVTLESHLPKVKKPRSKKAISEVVAADKEIYSSQENVQFVRIDSYGVEDLGGDEDDNTHLRDSLSENVQVQFQSTIVPQTVTLDDVGMVPDKTEQVPVVGDVKEAAKKKKMKFSLKKKRKGIESDGPDEEQVQSHDAGKDICIDIAIPKSEMPNQAKFLDAATVTPAIPQASVDVSNASQKQSALDRDIEECLPLPSTGDNLMTTDITNVDQLPATEVTLTKDILKLTSYIEAPSVPAHPDISATQVIETNPPTMQTEVVPVIQAMKPEVKLEVDSTIGPQTVTMDDVGKVTDEMEQQVPVEGDVKETSKKKKMKFSLKKKRKGKEADVQVEEQVQSHDSGQDRQVLDVDIPKFEMSSHARLPDAAAVTPEIPPATVDVSYASQKQSALDINIDEENIPLPPSVDHLVTTNIANVDQVPATEVTLKKDILKPAIPFIAPSAKIQPDISAKQEIETNPPTMQTEVIPVLESTIVPQTVTLDDVGKVTDEIEQQIHVEGDVMEASKKKKMKFSLKKKRKGKEADVQVEEQVQSHGSGQDRQVLDIDIPKFEMPSHARLPDAVTVTPAILPATVDVSYAPQKQSALVRNNDEECLSLPPAIDDLVTTNITIVDQVPATEVTLTKDILKPAPSIKAPSAPAQPDISATQVIETNPPTMQTEVVPVIQAKEPKAKLKPKKPKKKKKKTKEQPYDKNKQMSLSESSLNDMEMKAVLDEVLKTVSVTEDSQQSEQYFSCESLPLDEPSQPVQEKVEEVFKDCQSEEGFPLLDKVQGLKKVTVSTEPDGLSKQKQKKKKTKSKSSDDSLKKKSKKAKVQMAEPEISSHLVTDVLKTEEFPDMSDEGDPWSDSSRSNSLRRSKRSLLRNRSQEPMETVLQSSTTSDPQFGSPGRGGQRLDVMIIEEIESPDRRIEVERIVQSAPPVEVPDPQRFDSEMMIRSEPPALPSKSPVAVPPLPLKPPVAAAELRQQHADEMTIPSDVSVAGSSTSEPFVTISPARKSKYPPRTVSMPVNKQPSDEQLHSVSVSEAKAPEVLPMANAPVMRKSALKKGPSVERVRSGHDTSADTLDSVNSDNPKKKVAIALPHQATPDIKARVSSLFTFEGGPPSPNRTADDDLDSPLMADVVTAQEAVEIDGPLATPSKEAIQLSYVDFFPAKIGQQHKFATFSNLVDRANIWLEKRPNFNVFRCETVEFKKRSDDVKVDNNTMCYREMAGRDNKYVKALRLWIRDRVHEDPPGPDFLGYFNVLPHQMETPDGSVKYSTLPQAMDYMNACLRVDPMPGKLLNAEHLEMKVTHMDDELDPDCNFWVEDDETNTIVYFVRIFFKHGEQVREDLECIDFVPKITQGSKSLSKCGFESLNGVVKQARDWLNVRKKQYGRLVSVQSVNYRAKHSWSGKAPDTYQMVHTQGRKTTHLIQCIRLTFTQVSNEMDVMPGVLKPFVRLYHKSFRPVLLTKPGMCSKITFETFSQTMDRVMAWITAARCQLFAIETSRMRVKGGNRTLKPDNVHTTLMGEDELILYFIRVYLDGPFVEPPPEDLPPVPEASKQDPCCTLS